MKKIIYSGKEEGVFVFSTFNDLMPRIGADNIDQYGKSSPPENSMNMAWSIKSTGLRIDYLVRSLDKEGPITVLGSGDNEKLGEFERFLLKEHQKLREKK